MEEEIIMKKERKKVEAGLAAIAIIVIGITLMTCLVIVIAKNWYL